MQSNTSMFINSRSLICLNSVINASEEALSIGESWTTDKVQRKRLEEIKEIKGTGRILEVQQFECAGYV